ncbi:MAG TPA: formylglycine-generating enzyme family protein [Anaerolineales bacterium]|nr:formylglycine-generating enzyme family protein [Anaerolineales bacterium]
MNSRIFFERSSMGPWLIACLLLLSITAACSMSQTSSSEVARQLAEAGVSSNDEWTVYSEIIAGVEMNLVPAGCFMMGSSDELIYAAADEKPAHEVCFDVPFWIDTYEVTNEQYGEAGHWSENELPRESIAWEDALAYCENRGARLPTEAEWEYAARGPDNLEYPWGNEFVAANAVVEQNAGAQTNPIGSKAEGRSWIGAYDMSGNVWEWVSDWYAHDYYSSEALTNPQGPERGTYKAIKGGSWSNDSIFVRSANRGMPISGMSGNVLGFRCASSP